MITIISNFIESINQRYSGCFIISIFKKYILYSSNIIVEMNKTLSTLRNSHNNVCLHTWRPDMLEMLDQLFRPTRSFRASRAETSNIWAEKRIAREDQFIREGIKIPRKRRSRRSTSHNSYVIQPACELAKQK